MFGNLVIVVAVAFAAPFLLGLRPSLLLPSVVLEIVAGIVAGPSVLGLVEVDQALEVIALVGLAFVLFLAGLEIELGKLGGTVLRLTALGFAASFGDRARRRARPPGRRPDRHAAARRDHPLRHLARRADPRAQGRGRDRQHVRAAGRRRGVGRRLRRDRPALDLLLRRGRHRLDAAAARVAVRARRGRLRRGQGRRPLDADPRRPAAAAGHDRPDPRARGARPVRRIRRRRRAARARGDPRHVHRRRRARPRRPRRSR